MKESSYKFYALPGLDARIGLAIQDGLLALTLLAEGCSRSGEKGSYVYKRRNPDRRKVANALLTHEAMGAAVCGPLLCRSGKASNRAAGVASMPDVLAAFRKGGNHRFQFQATAGSGLETTAAIANALGLEPVANRPVKVTWFRPEATKGGDHA